MKKYVLPILLLLLTLTLAACGSQTNPTLEEANLGKTSQEQAGPLLLGVVTCGEPYSDSGRFVERLLAEQDESDSVQLLHQVWPDDFLSNPEQTRQTIRDLLDQDVQGLLIIDAFSGLTEILAEELDDWEGFLAIGNPGDPLSQAAALADLVLLLDEETMGSCLAEKAYDLGAETLVYYYNEQDFGEQGTLAAQLQLAQVAHSCVQNNMSFIPVLLPQEGSSMFIQEDVPQKVAQYGADTAFFGGSTAAIPVAESAIGAGAISPTMGYYSPYGQLPAVLGFEVEDQYYGDYDWLDQQLKDKLAEFSGEARLAYFPVDFPSDLPLRTALAYGEERLGGDGASDQADLATLRRIMEGITNGPCNLRYYENDGVTYENCVLYSMEPQTLR